jgi:hypothetical protein
MYIPVSFLIFFATLATGALCAYLAHRAGSNFYIWFFIGFMFGILGVFGAFTLLAISSRKKKLPKYEQKISIPSLSAPQTIQGPSDKFWYYLNPEHKQVGPMSLVGLTNAWQQGKISLTTYVWNEELPGWKPLQDLITTS